MGSVNDWECGLSSPVILCRHLRHLIVLPRQASDIKVNCLATHAWGLAPQIRFVSLSFSTLLETRTVVGLLAFIFPMLATCCFYLHCMVHTYMHLSQRPPLSVVPWVLSVFALRQGLSLVWGSLNKRSKLIYSIGQLRTAHILELGSSEHLPPYRQ